jgi:hypothetical protein
MPSDLVEDLDIVSAIWILACNDEISLMTYNGIRDRLGLPDDYDVAPSIRKRAELFRPGAGQRQLDAWKSEMRQNRHRPGWIRRLPDEAARLAAIEALTPKNVFRSQFRTIENSERSALPVIQWGLEHIDRLRKARVEARAAAATSSQMWLVFGVSVAGIITQVLLAFLGPATAK